MNLIITFAAVVAVAVAKPSYSYEAAYSHGGYHGPAAPLAHDGTVVDTPEVAHAKAAHFAAYAEAAAKTAWSGPSSIDEEYGYDHGSSAHAPSGYVSPIAYTSKVAHIGHGYHGPPAPLDHEGRVIDTPEIAHLKAAHFAAHAEAAAKAHQYGGSHGVADGYDYQGYEQPASAGYHGLSSAYSYHGPAAPLAHDGTVIDTPEVAHAKAAHLATHSAAYTRGSHYNYDSAYNKW